MVDAEEELEGGLVVLEVAVVVVSAVVALLVESAVVG